jgi:ketosteroid isomerase-like protein
MRLTRYILALALLAGCKPASISVDHEALRRDVLAAEGAFARSMAERDHAAFSSFVADEAVFFAGETPLRGRADVVESWRPYFESEQPPFSWEPQNVEVLESGTLALSSGPVRDPAGAVIATFNSIWRLESDGRWRVVFDKGYPACNCR